MYFFIHNLYIGCLLFFKTIIFYVKPMKKKTNERYEKKLTGVFVNKNKFDFY